jgi:hypothetical protein
VQEDVEEQQVAIPFCRAPHDANSFAVVVLDVFRDGAAEVPLAHRNQPVQAFFFDRPHEPFRIGVRIWRTRRRENHVNPRVPQLPPHLLTPLPIPITNQHVRRGDGAVFDHRQRPHDLLHEHHLGMGRRSEDLHTSGRQIDDKHRVRSFS